MMKRQEWEGKKTLLTLSFVASFFYHTIFFLKYHHKFFPVWEKLFIFTEMNGKMKKKRNTKILYFPVGLWNRRKFHSLDFAERTENERQEHIIKYRTLENFFVCRIKWIVIRMYDVWLFNNEGETCEQRNYKLWMKEVRAGNWWKFTWIWTCISTWA